MTAAGATSTWHLTYQAPTGGSPPFSPETVREGHPAIPAAALPLLGRRVSRGSGRPIMWWHNEGNAWDAVLDLHRASDHQAAVALAELLGWCGQNGASGAIWSIREGPLAPAEPVGSAS